METKTILIKNMDAAIIKKLKIIGIEKNWTYAESIAGLIEYYEKKEKRGA